MSEPNSTDTQFQKAGSIATSSEYDQYSGYALSDDRTKAIFFLIQPRVEPSPQPGPAKQSITIDTFDLESLRSRNENSIKYGHDNSLTSKALKDLEQNVSPAPTHRR
jgi:hypothetical protein